MSDHANTHDLLAIGCERVPACGEPARRARLRAAGHLNGIDYVEVGDDGVTLCLHLFGPIPPGIKPEHIRISGGDRITGLRAIDVQIDDDPEMHDEACLRILLDREGDHSPYCLCLVAADASWTDADDWRPYPGFDPRYACVELRFRLDCGRDMDCAGATPCVETAPPPPEINYLARDYESFRQLFLDRMAQTMPDWRERHVPDLGIALVEVLAYTADHLSYYQDAVATEAYLGTARKRISVRRHARLVDYRMHEGCNARALLTLSSDTDVTLAYRDLMFLVPPPGQRDLQLGRLEPGVLDPRKIDAMRAAGALIFEPVSREGETALEVIAAHSEIRFHTWGDELCCLPRGSTRATLRDPGVAPPSQPPDQPPPGELPPGEPPGTPSNNRTKPYGEPASQSRAVASPPQRALKLAAGDLLIFEEVRGPKTGNPADADPAHRHAVRITAVAPAIDPLDGSLLLEIAWAACDALPFDLCLSARKPAPDCAWLHDVGVARGNVVLVDHGERIDSLRCDCAPFCKPDANLELYPGVQAELEALKPAAPTGGGDAAALRGPCEACNALREDCWLVPGVAEYGCCACENAVHDAHRPPTQRTHKLPAAPITWAEPVVAGAAVCALFERDPRHALPQLTVYGGALSEVLMPATPATQWRWWPREDLLASGADERHFVVEIDDEGFAHLRFGDGVRGRLPQAGDFFRAAPRIGNGPVGNVGRDSIVWLAFKANPVFGVALMPRNPLPASGGAAPESIAEAKMFAPGAFRAQPLRAIVAEDYAMFAARSEGVQGAACALEWTGSWYEANVVVDPSGRSDLPEPLDLRIEGELERYRRIGHRAAGVRETGIPGRRHRTRAARSLRLGPAPRRSAGVLPPRPPASRRAGLRQRIDRRGAEHRRRVACRSAHPGAPGNLCRRQRARRRRAGNGAARSGARRQRSRPSRSRLDRVHSGRWPMSSCAHCGGRSRGATGAAKNNFAAHGCASHACACGCGAGATTPLPLYNRPGLDALSYRIGTYADFRATMQIALSDAALPALAGLRTREADDATMSLLDAWAVGADVLTFYQERIANEGYLRTATERRSVLELARLVDYKPRPGVAASVYLAYTIDKTTADKSKDPTIVPAGAKAQSVPAPGEQMQTFETAEDLEARYEWNALKPRLRLPQNITSTNAAVIAELWVQGTDTKLKLNDRLLFVFGDVQTVSPVVRLVQSVEVDQAADRTRIRLQPSVTIGAPPPPTAPNFRTLYSKLKAPPTLQPANSAKLARNALAVLGTRSDVRPQLLLNIDERLADNFYPAWTGISAGTPSAALTGVFALRVAAPLFGYNAPHRSFLNIIEPPDIMIAAASGDWQVDELADTLRLDNAYESIAKGSYLVIESGDETIVAKAESVQVKARTAYAVSAKTTEIVLENSSTDDLWPAPSTMAELRGARVLAQSDALTLVEVPVADVVGELASVEERRQIPGDDHKRLTLATALDGFKTGRWVVVEGQRVDLDGIDTVVAAELVMVEAIEQSVNPQIPGDRVHSTLIFANEGLAYRYKRDTVAIHANVVRATHGDTRSEALGNGDGAQMLQAFALKQSPLTYVSAATPAGVATTLTVRVNDLRWREIRNLAFAAEQDRAYVTMTDDEGKTRAIFGDGRHGARLPTGHENVRATYRAGIGSGGNVRARQISLATTRPLGVKEVVNPLRASGGADPENRDQARRNVPLAVMALDRLVSVPDYADFARTFGGVGKAAATRLGDLVHVTIAGAADAPIDATSDLYRNLLDALRRYGDPVLNVRLDVRELVALTMQAKVGLQPDYAWESVEPTVRAALLDRFGFERAELGRNVYRSEVVACIQAVRGVAWVDLDLFAGLDEAALLEGFSPTSNYGYDTSYNALPTSSGKPVLSTAASSAVIVLPARWQRGRNAQPDILRPAQPMCRRTYRMCCCCRR
jgi:predicted phage baseplate assembly protein